MKSEKIKNTKTIDWQAVRQQIAQFTYHSVNVTLEEDNAILKERAFRLAQPLSMDAAPGTELLEALTFSMREEQYGIETSYVREIDRLTVLSPVPEAPEILLGITHSRGKIFPVFDIGKLIGLAGGNKDNYSRMVVLGRSEPEFGILADDVHEVKLVDRSELLPPSGSIIKNDIHLVLGVTIDALILLNGDKLLTHKDLFIDES